MSDRYAVKKVVRDNGDETFYPMKKGVLWGWNHICFITPVALDTMSDAVKYIEVLKGEKIASNTIIEVRDYRDA